MYRDYVLWSRSMNINYLILTYDFQIYYLKILWLVTPWHNILISNEFLQCNNPVLPFLDCTLSILGISRWELEVGHAANSIQPGDRLHQCAGCPGSILMVKSKISLSISAGEGLKGNKINQPGFFFIYTKKKYLTWTYNIIILCDRLLNILCAFFFNIILTLIWEHN